jgi:NAD(P)-dependent dehydrogenase (short-subunit alcohol dehydrogenase family)
MRLEGIAAIVTGGASGLGAATAALLATRGAKVTLFDMNADLGKQTAAEIGGAFQLVNVADEASVVAGFDGAEAAHGPARLLVNCAGVAPAEKTVNREGAPHSSGN